MKTHNLAKKYISLGWKIHPLKTKSKMPATRNGFKDATCELEQASKWFKGTNHNIAIVTGKESGIAVIDVDPKNGGFDSFKILKEKYGLDDDTFCVETGSGGFHLYYKIEEDIKSRNGILPGIDVKAKGGYIVAPPSIHPNGKSYLIKDRSSLDELTLKPFPREIIAEIDRSKQQSKKESYSSHTQYLEGSRHNGLVSRMGKLRGLGMEKTEVAEKLLEENQLLCSPPLSKEEVNQISDSFKERTFDEILLYAPHTDLGNAERFKAYCEDNVLYSQKMDKWFIYDGKRYRVDDGGQITQIAKGMLRQIRDKGENIYSHNGESLSDHLKKSEAINKINALIKLAQSEMPICPSKFDQESFLFNVENGTLDLKTGALHRHNKLHKFTKISNITYDKNAKCPRWERFLEEVTLNSVDLIHYLQRVVGYCLTGEANEQCFWILNGLGANGKSTFIDIVKHLLGEYGRTADISTFTYKKSEQIRNDLARLYDARLVTSVEIQEGKLLDESVIKQVTGGDPVTCRFLFKEHFEFIPKWKLFMAVNHLPIINGTDHGIWRRIKCIPFNAHFSDSQKDKDLPHKLREELPGILNWAINGCLEWQKQGLHEPREVIDAVKNFRINEDFIQEFLDEYTDIGLELQEGATALFTQFANHQKSLGQRMISQKLFSQKLRIKGFEKRRGTGGRLFYLGLKLKKFISYF